MDRMGEFKDQNPEELQALYEQLSREIYELKNEVSTTRKIDKSHLLPLKRRNRARVLTLLNQKTRLTKYKDQYGK